MTQYLCYHCKRAIFFDDWHVTKSGKKIPLSLTSVGGLEPHSCPDKPFKIKIERTR
jgi:hypothetical protein